MKKLLTIALNKGTGFDWLKELSSLDNDRNGLVKQLKEYIQEKDLVKIFDFFYFCFFDKRVSQIVSWLCCQDYIYPEISQNLVSDKFADLLSELRLNKELKKSIAKFFNQDDIDYDFIGDLECVIERLRRFYIGVENFNGIDNVEFQSLLDKTLCATIRENNLVVELLKAAHLLNGFIPSLECEEGAY